MTGNNNKKEIAVIAGMAAGFGVALARELLQAGYAVLGLSRTAAKENDLAQEVSDFRRQLPALRLRPQRSGPGRADLQRYRAGARATECPHLQRYAAQS